MCGSSKSKNINYSTEVIPEWIQASGQQIFQNAMSQFGQPFESYSGDRVAQPGAGFDQAKARFAAYQAQPANTLDSMLSGYKNVADATAPGKSVSDYMSPYTEGVLAPVLRKLRERGAALRNDTAAEAAMAGAYGDSRHGVADALNARMIREAETDATNSAYQSAFDRATAERGADYQRYLGAMQGMGGVQQMRDSREDNILSRMMGMAEYERSLKQAGLDAQYGEFMRGQTMPLQQQQTLMQMLSQVPYPRTSYGMGTQQQPNTGGYGVAGSAIGAMLSLMPSDRRLKTDIELVGELDNGLKVYRYRYKDGSPTMLGLMAQEVAERNPGAVGIMPGGWLGVDYSKATEA